MIKFDNTMFGRQVRFINNNAHEEMPECYPPVGAIGIIVSAGAKYSSYLEDCDFLVKWPDGSTSDNDIWACDEESVELVEEITDYTPEKYGIVEAIRIFYGKACWPYATLAFAFGGTVTIDWANVEERNKYMPGINAYTLIVDDRVKKNFEDYVRVRGNYES